MLAPASLERAYYHCVSRVVNRDFVLREAEKDHFVRLMRLYEKLYGLRVIAYCIMSNHFHILVEVPRRPAEADLPDNAALVALVRSTLGDRQANELEWQLDHFRSIGAEDGVRQLREQWFSRMWSVSQFMKILKQRFTQWFNGRHNRRGTLWEDRFRSVLVQGECRALQTMAAYIDLNPVRAKICDDPKDYRWSGYAEAVAGGRLARQAVAWLASLDPHGGPRREGLTQREALARWRCGLFGVPFSEVAQAEQLARGGEAATIWRKRIPREKALEVLAAGGRLSQADYLRCRVRYFTDGAAIGTRDFVEQIFRECRERFSPGRTTGARHLRGLELLKKPERLYALRQLQKQVVG
jgi:REP element-mobilizing transposase RayT